MVIAAWIGKTLPFLWNSIVHYYVHYSPPLDHIVSKLNPVHTLTPHSFRTNSDIPHLCLHVPSGHFPLGLQLNFCINLSNTITTIVRLNNNKDYICSQSYAVLISRFTSYARWLVKRLHTKSLYIRTEKDGYS
jgi:hypothetical protein